MAGLYCFKHDGPRIFGSFQPKCEEATLLFAGSMVLQGNSSR